FGRPGADAWSSRPPQCPALPRRPGVLDLRRLVPVARHGHLGQGTHPQQRAGRPRLLLLHRSGAAGPRVRADRRPGAMIVFGFAETVTFAIAGDGLHRPAAFVGIMVAVQGIGALAGGLTAARLIRRHGELRVMALGLLLAAAGFVLELPPILATVLGGEILVGAGLPWLVVALISLAQRLTPADVQGRVFAAAETLITTPQTIAIALGA